MNWIPGCWLSPSRNIQRFVRACVCCVCCTLLGRGWGAPFAGNCTIPHSCASMFGPPNKSGSIFFHLPLLSFFFYRLFIAPRTRPHTCTRSQRKRRNTSTERETYVKMLNRASARDERVHKLFSFFFPSFTAERLRRRRLQRRLQQGQLADR